MNSARFIANVADQGWGAGREGANMSGFASSQWNTDATSADGPNGIYGVKSKTLEVKMGFLDWQAMVVVVSARGPLSREKLH